MLGEGRGSNGLLQGLLELLPEPVWVKDMAGVYVFGNQAFADLVERPLFDIMGKVDREILPSSALAALRKREQRIKICPQRGTLFEKLQGEGGNPGTSLAPPRDEYIVGGLSDSSLLVGIKKENSQLREKLHDKDVALRALLDLREGDKRALESRTTEALTESVLPYLHKLQQGRIDSVQGLLLDTVIENILSLMLSHSSGMAHILLSLTPTEMQIAELVRKGLTGKEIATKLGLSPATVNTHRRNMRKRLGLNKKKINLRQFLLAR